MIELLWGNEIFVSFVKDIWIVFKKALGWLQNLKPIASYLPLRQSFTFQSLVCQLLKFKLQLFNCMVSQWSHSAKNRSHCVLHMFSVVQMSISKHKMECFSERIVLLKAGFSEFDRCHQMTFLRIFSAFLWLKYHNHYRPCAPISNSRFRTAVYSCNKFAETHHVLVFHYST